MVTSTMGMPPFETASAANKASSEDQTRMAGMMPISSTRRRTSSGVTIILPIDRGRRCSGPFETLIMTHSRPHTVVRWVEMSVQTAKRRTVSERSGGVQEALQVAGGDLGQSRRDVIQFPGAHPTFQLFHQAEQVVERIDDEQ